MARHTYDDLPWWRRPRPSAKNLPSIVVGLVILGSGAVVGGIEQVIWADSVGALLLGLLLAAVGALPAVGLVAYLIRPVR